MIPQYAEYREAVEEELRAVFEGRSGFLYDLLRYHLGWVDAQGQPQPGGSPLAFPSALALAACAALAGDYRRALPAAAGVALVHHFTLVHGEVQAGRAEDPDRPSIWWVWGPAQAINAGDGLHALGRTTIMRLAQRGVPDGRVLRAVRALDLACLSLCEGQYLDLDFQDRPLVTRAAYLDMIDRKAGALAGCSAEAGALAANAPDAVCDALAGLGRQLGSAWQIARDIQELWGERGDGLTPGNLLNKKKSLPLIYALEHGSIAARRELGAIYMKRVLEPEDAARLIAILEAAYARRPAEAQARELVDAALSAAASAGVGAAGMQQLGSLGDWALAAGTPPAG